MKTRLHILSLFLVTLIVSCSPKNEEVKDEQVEVGPPSEALDSIADTEKDALKTDENEISPTMPLPPPVLRLLADRYPGFEQPTLTDDARKLADAHEQGPFIVRGDFNGDTRQDYALQLQQEKNVHILAILDAGDDNWDVYELQQDILFNERGKLKSLYYLYLTEAGETLQNPETDETIETTTDAISVGLEGKATTYLFAGDAFSKYNAVE